jgi:hypothetical protein
LGDSKKELGSIEVGLGGRELVLRTSNKVVTQEKKVGRQGGRYGR